MAVGFIPVDELTQKIEVQTVVDFYGVAPAPTLQQKRNEIRTRCFLNCGKAGQTGPRALAIQADHPAKRWKCWEKGCDKSGNLVSLCDLLKDGDNHGGRPKGQRFKEIAHDLEQMAGEANGNESATTASLQHTVRDQCQTTLVCKTCSKPNPGDAESCHDCGDSLPQAAGQTKREETPASSDVSITPTNVPLAESDNERARELVTLDDKFLLPSQIGDMPPAASRYFRKRLWLTDDLARKFRMGYLPRDAGGDKSGGTMRGKIVYGLSSETGDILTWFGRDPDFETKAAQANGTKNPPQKFRFVKGFQRGLELFGQEQLKRNAEYARQRLAGLGLPIVAGANDVMRLDGFGIPSVALCSEEYLITREQAEKIAEYVRELRLETAVVLLPVTERGERGLRQCLGYLFQVTGVRGWTSQMFGHKYVGREVESLEEGQWNELEDYLRNGTRKGWSLA